MSLRPLPRPLSGGQLALLWVDAILAGIFISSAFSLGVLAGWIILFAVALLLWLPFLFVEIRWLRWVILWLVLAGLIAFAAFYPEYARSKIRQSRTTDSEGCACYQAWLPSPFSVSEKPAQGA
jgi:hypothetical protein